MNPIFPSLCFALLACSTAAQSLIQNGSFEDHAVQKCLECNTLYGQYPGLVYHWDNNGWGCQLFDKDYKRSSDDNKWKAAPSGKMLPKHGKAMIEMWHSPGCGGGEYMCATYLTARTTQALEVGHVYEASFWVYIESSKRADPERAKHIGIALLPQNIEYRINGGKKRLNIPFMGVDTVIYDDWYQVKWRVKPLCRSNYLTIGLFPDEQWPASRNFDDFRYFVDNVSLTEIPTQTAAVDSSIYYCSKYDPIQLGVTPKIDNLLLYFENDAFALTPEHRTMLDSFAVFARKYPDLVFEVSGHTDDTGSQNQQLSENRSQSVIQYLVEKHHLPSFRFLPFAMGSKDPFRPNDTEEGRILNRRAEIRQSHLNLPNIFYRNALKAVEEKRYPEAFISLNKWLVKLDKAYGSGMIVKFDPRFDVLRQDKRWEPLNKRIHDKYAKLKYPVYAYALDSLSLDERKATAALTLVGYQSGLNALTGYHPELDEAPYEISPLPDSDIQKKHQQHLAFLRTVLEKTGWPPKSEFGESASNAAFSILMNANEPVENLRWLPKIQASCEEGETPWIQYARLYDHTNVSLSLPQRYATEVWYLEDGSVLVKPWEGDVDAVNAQRAKIGLPELSQAVTSAMGEGK